MILSLLSIGVGWIIPASTVIMFVMLWLLPDSRSRFPVGVNMTPRPDPLAIRLMLECPSQLRAAGDMQYFSVAVTFAYTMVTWSPIQIYI